MIYDHINIQDYKGNEIFNYYDKEYEKYYPKDLGKQGAIEKAEVIDSFINMHFNSIVDIGCGPGVFLQQISKMFNAKKSVGTDISMFI